MRSCILPVGTIVNRAITTIEAIGDTPNGAKIQKAWLDIEVVQCGYCQSGQIMAAAALLATTPNPDDSDIDAAMAGNIPRCGTYLRIRAALKQTASGRPSSEPIVPVAGTMSHHVSRPPQLTARPAAASAPRQSQALAEPCAELSDTQTRYPGTNLTLTYSVKGQPRTA